MRVLLIEDEPEVCELVRKTLSTDAHAVDFALDGERGLDLALSEDYDLIIIDILLPHRTGLAVLKTIRDEGIAAPVLVLTARGAIADRVIGLDAGADDYMCKPFAIAELRARVRALLRRGSPSKEQHLRVAALVLDPAAHEVKIEGTLLNLTNREYAILEYFLRNKGRLLSKGMIAEHVWDYHFDSDYNLIEVYVRRLRAKIGALTPKPFIHTIRNAGYILKEPDA